MPGSEVYMQYALEQLRLAHQKLVAADSHLLAADAVEDQVLLHSISRDLAKLIRRLESEVVIDG